MHDVIFSNYGVDVVRKDNGKLYAVFDSDGIASYLVEVEITDVESKEIMKSSEDAYQVILKCQVEGRTYRQHDGVKIPPIKAALGKITHDFQTFPSNDPRWPASQGWVKKIETVTGGGEVIVYHSLKNTRTGDVADFRIVNRESKKEAE